MDKVTSIRIRQEDGELSDNIPISVFVENIMYNHSTSLEDKIQEIISLINQLQNKPIKDSNNILVF